MPILISKKLMLAFKSCVSLYLLWMWSSFWGETTHVFSSHGMFKDYNFPWGFNLLNYLPDFGIKTVLLLLMALTLSVLIKPKWWSWLSLWYGWFIFCSKIPYYVNPPNVSYIGFLLLCLVFVDEKEEGAEVHPWLWWGMWIVMGLSYSVSGMGKIISSPNWQQGSTLLILLRESFIQKDNFLVDFSLNNPVVMTTISFITLASEVLFIFLIFNKWTRYLALVSMTSVHVGIFLLLKIDSIPLGMLLYHLFMFIGTTLPWRRRA